MSYWSTKTAPILLWLSFGQVVKVDVERSLWAYTIGWSEVQRDEKRAALKRLLTAVVTHSGGVVHYYQVEHCASAHVIVHTCCGLLARRFAIS